MMQNTTLRLLPICLLAAALLGGCIDFNQHDDCTSDDDCRFGRVCSEITGACVDTASTSDTVDSPDASCSVRVSLQI
ncbi:hypothetical protein FIV42_07850 [Persicimonas caeni]|uniref:Dickkopf N-terminal cysteine-rich domain-containing protein n=1 Tax=Persicimonas caeni TaxID=2292766 RepID=A0A4Y6PRK4_PERCE|nr:hypothetical protein [Persicimonas caeni]QDG50647.1 hypothetical protein FIV42_07850 [Persicimonas caeni]QED31868.1 hypothetical protein FRD00_07845 [Persicimonas caeni]